MRYAVQSYSFRGTQLMRVVDTFNGGKIVAKGLTHDAAFARRDELNATAVEHARTNDSVAFAQPSRVDGQLTFAEESLKTPRDASAAASLIASACFNDEIKAIVARQLLRSIVRPHDAAIAVQLEKAQDAASSLVNAFDRQYRD
jgi:hypothetical protein